MNILGIESSCDETSVAIISDDVLKTNLVSSQDFHKKFGGVVPELSSRAHLQQIVPLLRLALKESKLELNEIDLISATAGPGLIGAILVGFIFGKGLSYSLKKPFIPVNHIEGHIYSGFLMKEKPEFPFLVLVVSGGHTLLLVVESFSRIKKLGSTIDDAAGEAFDKVAKMLGLGYPGGPKIQEYAEKSNGSKIVFPIAQLKNEFDFSFSGLKTSVLRFIQKEYGESSAIPEKELFDIAEAFQKTAVKSLTRNVERAINKYQLNSISLVGGVAANSFLRDEFTLLGKKYNKKVVIPDLQFCGDNAAMIANRAKNLFDLGETFDLDYEPFPSFFSKYFQ
ncbi:MAG: tRNA (adenosine(37)-N6)-threonylcarbamoyltransferase complex transferase subunit TsaD [Chlorobiaceae bacterium]|nr:tRNA (adenosine(37)-N6)-threonylcarbamoyltransferase complex transferase subunit TsaD [Chlorobiaceae bacterium]MBA4308814.1 tRNA (adenosine(37)-N6)-threonylcarbamoyltransferase complex transferase subunit TsaD [Chlorobiaceae bacterium]